MIIFEFKIKKGDDGYTTHSEAKIKNQKEVAIVILGNLRNIAEILRMDYLNSTGDDTQMDKVFLELSKSINRTIENFQFNTNTGSVITGRGKIE